MQQRSSIAITAADPIAVPAPASDPAGAVLGGPLVDDAGAPGLRAAHNMAAEEVEIAEAGNGRLDRVRWGAIWAGLVTAIAGAWQTIPSTASPWSAAERARGFDKTTARGLCIRSHSPKETPLADPEDPHAQA